MVLMQVLNAEAVTSKQNQIPREINHWHLLWNMNNAFVETLCSNAYSSVVAVTCNARRAVTLWVECWEWRPTDLCPLQHTKHAYFKTLFCHIKLKKTWSWRYICILCGSTGVLWVYPESFEILSYSRILFFNYLYPVSMFHLFVSSPLTVKTSFPLCSPPMFNYRQHALHVCGTRK